MAREAFVAALGDSALQLKVMECEPKSVEDALNYATKQEAFETSLLAYGHMAYGHAKGQEKVFHGKQLKVRALEDGGRDTDMSSLRQQVNQLQAELSKTTRSLEGLAADAGRVQELPLGSSYAGCVQQVPRVVRSLNRTPVRLIDLRTSLDLRDRSKDRLLVVGIFPGRHQAEVVVWVEVVVCTGLHRAVMHVGRVARQAIGPWSVRNVRLVIKQ